VRDNLLDSLYVQFHVVAPFIPVAAPIIAKDPANFYSGGFAYDFHSFSLN
jgi:hypothetical protein